MDELTDEQVSGAVQRLQQLAKAKSPDAPQGYNAEYIKQHISQFAAENQELLVPMIKAGNGDKPDDYDAEYMKKFMGRFMKENSSYMKEQMKKMGNMYKALVDSLDTLQAQADSVEATHTLVDGTEMISMFKAFGEGMLETMGALVGGLGSATQLISENKEVTEATGLMVLKAAQHGGQVAPATDDPAAAAAGGAAPVGGDPTGAAAGGPVQTRSQVAAPGAGGGEPGSNPILAKAAALGKRGLDDAIMKAATHYREKGNNGMLDSVTNLAVELESLQGVGGASKLEPHSMRTLEQVLSIGAA